MMLSSVSEVFAMRVDVQMVCSAVSRTLALGPLLLLLLASSCCRCLYTISSSLFLVRRPDCAEDVPFCRLCVVAED